MSQIKQYQVKKCLSIIYDTYKNKNNRSFLVNPKMFDGAFDNVKDIDDTERKLKIVLLMLEKDLYEKYKNKIIVSRPSSLFTKSYVCIEKYKEDIVLSAKYKKYFKRIGTNGAIVEKQYKKDNAGDVVTTDLGDIFEIDLKSVWEDLYCSKMSFAAFKYNFYTKKNDVLSDISEFYHPRIKLKVKVKNIKRLNEIYSAAEKEIDYLTEKLNTFERKYFLKEEFKELIKEKYKNNSKAEIVANLYFNIIDPNKECIKSRTFPNGDVKFVVGDGRARSFAMNVILKSSLRKVLCGLNDVEFSQFYRENNNDARMLKLLSLLDIITYEIEGGNTPEIYIRLNAPDKIERILNDKVLYVNNYVERAQKRHYRAVKILEYFFKNDKIDRWDFVEKYFLGNDVESEIEEYNNSFSNKVQSYNISDYIMIDGENTYSLSDYNNWDEIIDNVLEEEKYIYYCNVMKKNNIRLPDYAYTDIVVKKESIPTLFIFADKNIIVLPEVNRNSTLKICKEKNWTTIPINEIEKYIELLKGE